MEYSKLGMGPTSSEENIALNNYLIGEHGAFCTLNEARGLWERIACDSIIRDCATMPDIHFWACDYNPTASLSYVEGDCELEGSVQRDGMRG